MMRSLPNLSSASGFDNKSQPPASNSRYSSLQIALRRLDQQAAVDDETYVKLLKQCGEARALQEGRLVHDHIVKSGRGRQRFLANYVIHMYGSCGSLDEARRVFDSISPNVFSFNILITAYARNGHVEEASRIYEQMPGVDAVTLNAMLTAYAQNGYPHKAIAEYYRMNLEGRKPNKVTFIAVLDACSRIGDWNLGKSLHDRIIQTGWSSNIMVATALLDMHGKCAKVSHARLVFDAMVEQNAVSQTAMLAAYALNGHLQEAQELFEKMPWNQHAATVLLQGYAQQGHLETAKQLFDRMPVRSSVPWNALMQGYAQHGHPQVAIELFKLMDLEGTQPCTSSCNICISACISSGSFSEGAALHSSIVGSGLESDKRVSNSLLHFYVKWGKVETAMQIFQKLEHRNVVSWTSLMSAFAEAGQADQALRVFSTMQLEGVEPDKITFTVILAACSHSGVLSLGLYWFKSIVADYSGKLDLGHYHCMIDLLGRSGHLEQAEELVATMPFEPDDLSRRLILMGSQIHGKSSGSVEAGETLSDVPSSSDAYVLLSKLRIAKLPAFRP